MKTIKYIFSIVLLLGALSCTEDPEIWNSSVVELSGNWYVQVFDNADNRTMNKTAITTFNTADDNGDMYVNLIPLGFGLVKVTTTDAAIDGVADNFSVTRTDNSDFATSIHTLDAPLALGITKAAVGDYKAFEISEGRILKNAVTANSGVSTDSINLKLIAYRNTEDFSSQLESIDTLWDVFHTDSTISYDIDTTTIVIPIDTVSAWYDENWVKLNDTVYYQIDSSKVITFTAFDSTLVEIDSTFEWVSNSEITEISEEHYISGYRKTGYTEDK
jgi:hypothetical protein